MVPESLSIVIPTYRREQVLLETLRRLLGLPVRADEILVVDQSQGHEPVTEQTLAGWHEQGCIRWLRLREPSIPRAMNAGLLEASGKIVLFLDDDIVPDRDLVRAHRQAQQSGQVLIVAGRVLQPWDEDRACAWGEAGFASVEGRWVAGFMGGNFSLPRQQALAIGGFDENFVRVAYHFEREFAERWIGAGWRILFVPEALIHHLRTAAGGTRSYGHHLTTLGPDHAVGAYYYLLRSRRGYRLWRQVLQRLAASVATRHHLRRPWWMGATLVAELRGLAWAMRLLRRGPRLLGRRAESP